MVHVNILVATTDPREISILQSMQNVAISNFFTPHIGAVVKTSGEAYRKTREMAPDLIIVEEQMFSASLNLLCENIDVLIITDDRRKKDIGNIHYYYKPVEVAFIKKRMERIFLGMENLQIEELRSFRRSDLKQFPETFPEADEKRLRHPEMSLMAECRINLEQIHNGSFHFSQPNPHQKSDADQINFYSPKILAMMGEQETDHVDPGSKPVDLSGEPDDVLNVVWLVKPSKSVYSPGETISPAGGKVGVSHRSGISEEILLTDENLPENPVVTQEMTSVSFRVCGHELPFDISVLDNRLVDLIVINPCRTEYMEGEKPDISKMLLYGKRADGRVEPITSFSYNDRPLTSEDTSLTFQAENQKISIPVHVKKNEILSAKLKKPPKCLYEEGEPLDLSGSIVLTQYVDGKTIERPLNEQDLVEPFDSKKIGEQTLFFKEGVGAIPVKVRVEAKKEKIPTAIMVYSRPNRITYPIGFRKLDVSGGMLSVYYSDETSEIIPMDEKTMKITVEEKDKKSAVVSISYLNLSTMFMIILTEPKLVRLEVKTPPSKTTYLDGERFVPDGMVLLGTYDNESVQEITQFSEEQGPVHYGDAVYPVKIDGISTPVFIKVERRTVAKALILKSLPVKTEYIVGSPKLDLLGIEVAQIDTSGQENPIDVHSCNVHGFDGNKVGQQQIILTYQNMSCSFEISVLEKRLIEIRIDQPPEKTSYFEGEAYDLSGLVVEAIYNNGTSEVVNDYEVDKQSASIGDTTVTVSLRGQTASFGVRVLKRMVESISLAKLPTKTEYMEGKDSFSSSGGELLVIYNDKSTKSISLTNDMVSGFSNQIPGRLELTVLYEGKTTVLPIMIQAKQLIGLTMENPPYKTNYLVGERFDPAGMKILGIYNNGETKPIYDYQYSPDGPLQITDGGIMIFFMNCSTACKIVVEPIPDTTAKIAVPPIGQSKENNDLGSEYGFNIPPFYPSSSGLRFDDEN